MGLFEKALKQREKKGLYKRLLEERKNPKSLFLKAKELKKQFDSEPTLQVQPAEEISKIEEIQLPEYDFEFQSPPEKDLEISDSLPDPFTSWEKEAKQFVDEKEKQELNENLISQYVETDDEISSLPEELHVASQKRLDYYLSLFDINDELQETSSLEELFESVAFNIQEQIGARSIVVFGRKDFESENVEHILSLGYDEQEVTIPLNDSFFSLIISSDEIYYLKSLRENLQKTKKKSIFLIDEKYKKLIDDFALCFILRFNQKIYSVFFISQPLEQKDYVLDDLEFIRVLIKLTKSKLTVLFKENEKSKEIKNIKKFYESSRTIQNFILEVAIQKNLDDLYEKLEKYLTDYFHITMFSFAKIVPAEGYYHLFSGKNISVDTYKKFQIQINSDFIGLVSNLTTIYNLENFRNYKEIIDSYTVEDISLMEKFIIVPFIHMNWLIGFLIIHKLEMDLAREDEEHLLYLATLLAPFVTNIIITEERELLFKDTFSPLRKRLEYEFHYAEETQGNLSVIDFRIKNLKRIIAINSLQQIEKYLKEIQNLLSETLYQKDYLSRMSQGRFIIILSGRSKEESQIHIKKLLQKIKDTNLFHDSSIQPIFTYEIISYPKDVEKLEKMLALLES